MEGGEVWVDGRDCDRLGEGREGEGREGEGI